MDRPTPIVYKPGTNKLRTREGRGFSLGEIQAVGLTVKRARKLGIYVDERRRSVHKHNVEILKKFLESLDVKKGG